MRTIVNAYTEPLNYCQLFTLYDIVCIMLTLSDFLLSVLSTPVCTFGYMYIVLQVYKVARFLCAFSSYPVNYSSKWSS